MVDPGAERSRGGAHPAGMTTTKPRPALLAPILAAHLVVAALVWRDLARRLAGSVRGGKNLWRVLSAANTAGSLAYVLVGRRT